jgi:hypothetical protein
MPLATSSKHRSTRAISTGWNRSNRRFKFESRSQLFLRAHNVTLAVINRDFGLALFAQQVDTNRPFQFQKCSQLFIGVHNEAPTVVAMRAVFRWLADLTRRDRAALDRRESTTFRAPHGNDKVI